MTVIPVNPQWWSRNQKMQTILAEGENCWRIEKTSRAAFLVDGERYFRALREVLLRAKHCIFIIGWDLHSELELVRDGHDDGHPRELGKLLNSLAKTRPDLNIYLLYWDFAMIYTLEREFFPRYKLQWKTHDRVHFGLDGKHSVGASHHEKLVVVDDRIAFCGGLDLSKWRWDTRAHSVEDDRRRDPDGEPYPPFHDVQMIVDDAAAAALGELVRQRWRQAGYDEPVARKPEELDDPWPPGIEPDMRDIDVAIARTRAAGNGRAEAREVERLHLHSIAAARRFIYIENQYLTSHAIGEALAQRLREADGPEVVVVMPQETGGWLEQHTMDVLRARLMHRLGDADIHNRLRVYYAQLQEDPTVALMVHAKLMVIDDCFVRIGSANLSNRSMGLDSECDLAVACDAGGDCAGTFAAFRRGLLAEHLGVTPDQVCEAEQQQGSLIGAIESLTGGDRTLRVLDVEIPENVDQLVPDSKLIDPEQPVEPEELFNYLVGAERQGRSGSTFLRVGILLAALFGMAAAWRWTPLTDWLNVERLSLVVEWMEQSRFTPVLVLGAFVLGGFMVIPVTLMIFATVLVLGPWQGLIYSMVGAEISAVLTFALGHWLGRDVVSRVAGSQINSVERALSDRGLLTTVTLRIVPVAPFTVINVIAGVSRIRFRDFAIGSFIGLLPGVFAIAFLADRVVASLEAPSATSLLWLVAALVAVVAALLGLRQVLQRWRIDRGD